MKNNSLEVKLIEDIQSRALSRINDLKEALNESNVLDPVKGKNLVDEYLWKTAPGRRTNSKPAFEDRNDTVYGSIADKVARAIVEWKESNKELPLSHLAIWVSYNSRLADIKWQDSERVLTADDELKSASYRITHLDVEALKSIPKGKKIVERTRDLVSCWFELLRDSFKADEENSILPSIHYYLSKFDPHFKGIKKRIHTVAFFSEERDEYDHSPFGKRHIRQENDILLRSRTDNDLYIKLSYNDTVETVENVIYNRLFKEVVFGSGEHKDDFPPPLTGDSAREWSKRFAAFLRGLILHNQTDDLEKLAAAEPDDGFRTALLDAIDEEKTLRRQKEIIGQPYRCMTNVFIKVPNSGGDLGSVIVFSDRVINPALTRIISSSIWAVFSHLREVEENVISKNTFKKHTSRSAIAAIMGRNMSHNIGSHVLWHLGRDIEYNGECPENTQYFLSYLQQRMDFIAQITTSPVSWCQSLNFKQLMKSFDEKQTVLKDNIARSYSEDIKLEFNFKGIKNDIEVDIPGGMVGAQALYSILENIIRNAAKHGDREGLDRNQLNLELRLEVPGFRSSSSSKNEWKKRFYKLTIVDNLHSKPDVKEKLDKSLSEAMIDDEGSVKSGSWGMKEIKICASYLRRIEQHNIDLNYLQWKSGKEFQNPPIVEVEIESDKRDEAGALAYSFYLLQPKMAAIINWEAVERKKDRDKHSIKDSFRERGIDIMDEEEFTAEFDHVALRHDFVVLPIEFYRDRIKKNDRQHELPTRVFLISPSSVALRESESELAVSIQPHELERFTDAPDKLKFFLWRKWIEKFYGNYYLYVRWNKFPSAQMKFNYQPDGEIEFDRQSSRRSLIEFVRETVDAGINNSLVFDHQKWRSESDLSAKAVFQESLDDISPVRNMLSHIQHDLNDKENLTPKEKMQLALSVFLLKEAAAVTVGILDNRIYRQGKLQRGEKGYGFGKFPADFTLAETWEKRRVYFLDPKLAKEDFELFVEQSLFPPVEKRGFEKYDFLILHQGDLDEIQSKMAREEKDFESVWKKLEQKAKYVIIVTGRGRPQIATNRKLRWLGYSALADELLGRSKIELVEMLYSLRATVNAENL